jgi:hypothetical protein
MEFRGPGIRFHSGKVRREREGGQGGPLGEQSMGSQKLVTHVTIKLYYYEFLKVKTRPKPGGGWEETGCDTFFPLLNYLNQVKGN